MCLAQCISQNITKYTIPEELRKSSFWEVAMVNPGRGQKVYDFDHGDFSEIYIFNNCLRMYQCCFYMLFHIFVILFYMFHICLCFDLYIKARYILKCKLLGGRHGQNHILLWPWRPPRSLYLKMYRSFFWYLLHNVSVKIYTNIKRSIHCQIQASGRSPCLKSYVFLPRGQRGPSLHLSLPLCTRHLTKQKCSWAPFHF